MKKPVKVVVTGAAGQIGYSLLFRIGAGDMLGTDQPIDLMMLERNNEQSLKNSRGVQMELDDCAFPLLNSITATSDPYVCFKDAEIALLIGSRPRTADMQRADLLAANAQIFVEQGKAMNEVADRNIKVLVVGNPCNTNAYIARRCSPDLNPRNFTAMMRLDENRTLTQVAQKANSTVAQISKLAVWGNHGGTMFPDLTNATVAGKPALDLITEDWYVNELIPTVAKRGSAIIQARGHSSAASAANAAIDHIHDWVLGSNGEWATMAVPSDGSYGIPEGLTFGMPVICKNGDYEIVKDLELNQFQKDHIAANIRALEEERAIVDEIIAKA